MTATLARLIAALGVALACVVLPGAPATASCAYDVVGALQEDPAVAFVGVDTRRVSDGDRLIVRFRVERVHRGEVRRTQDVAVPDDESSSAGGADWSTGDRVLVLGDLTEAGTVSTSSCLAAAEGSREYDAALRELGQGTEPLPGVDRIDPDSPSRGDLRWIKLVIGVVGLAALGVMASSRLRRRSA